MLAVPHVIYNNVDSKAQCEKIADSHCAASCPGNHSQSCGGGWALQVLPFTCKHAPTPTATAVVVEWAPYDVGTHAPSAPFTRINASYLNPKLPPAEQKREELQRGLATGKPNNHMHKCRLDAVAYCSHMRALSVC